jgi:hypothetical protein
LDWTHLEMWRCDVDASGMAIGRGTGAVYPNAGRSRMTRWLSCVATRSEPSGGGHERGRFKSVVPIGSTADKLRRRVLLALQRLTPCGSRTAKML